MSPTVRRADTKGESRATNAGLFRTILAGAGRTLADAFATLEHAPEVDRITRHAKRGLLGARITVPSDEGEGYWDLTRIRDDIYVVVANYAYKDQRLEIVPGDGLVQFNFRLSGDMSLAVSRAEPLRWNRPSMLVWAQPAGVDIDEWTAASSRERYIMISIRPEFLAEHFLSLPDGASEQLQAFVAAKREKLIYTQRPLSSQTFEVSTRLMTNPFTGTLALVYTEALVLELLCCAVLSLASNAGSSTEEYTARELKCLHAARDILTRQLAAPPSLTKLARTVGMAKSTLTGFKAVFGETIVDYSLGCRMRHAMILIRDHAWSVAKVSEEVGYAHPTSFTTAFRQHFNLRPIDVKRVKSRE